MASRKNNKKKHKKNEKPSFWNRVKRFFSDIKAELKRVTWPDKKRLKANTGTVISIIIISMAMIFIFDTAISSLLSATGFYTYENKSETEITENIEDVDSDTEISDTSE